MKKLLIFVLAVVSLGVAQQLDQPSGFGTTGQAIKFTASNDRAARRFEYVYGGTLSTVSTVLKGCMRGDTCDTLETSTSTSNTSRCVNDIYDYFTITPTFTGGTSPTLTVNMTSGPSSVCDKGDATATVVAGATTAGTASANSIAGTPMICDSANSGTVTQGQAQMVRCNTAGSLSVGFISAAGDNASNANAGGLINSNASVAFLTSFPQIFNGGGWDRARSADLTNYNTSSTTTAANSIGAQLVEKGSRWSVIHNPAANSQATASIASEASVRHVVDCVSFSAGATTAPALTALTINVRDGASGAGTIIWTYQVIIPAATGQSVAPHSICGLNLVGTTATAMTAEFSAGLTSLIESVSISGFNVN